MGVFKAAGRTGVHIIAAAALLTSACARLQPTEKAAVDYNRSFARARDEITVLNILRAAQRQPLQFSTVASVTGGVHTGATLTLPFAGLISDKKDAFDFSPGLGLTSRNPSVTINPLATKEFIQGLRRPLPPELMDDLVVLGWPVEVVLSLMIGGIQCGDGSVRLNTGDNALEDYAFYRMINAVKNYDLGKPTYTDTKTFRMTGENALKYLKEGVGEGFEIVSTQAGPETKDGMVPYDVTIGKPAVAIQGLASSYVCGDATGKGMLTSTTGPSIIMRSVLGVFLYLGRSQALRQYYQAEVCSGREPKKPAPPLLLNIAMTCGDQLIPPHAFVSTEFQGRRFFVRPLAPETLVEDAEPTALQKETKDRTLDTLSLLSFLVDLKTNEEATKGPVPVVTIAQ